MAKKDDLVEQARAAGLQVTDDDTIESLEAKLAANEQAREDAGVAQPADNAALEHSQGGVTTRDDTHDLGVPMLQGSPEEPTGPEDALGQGPKRGDYSERQDTTAHFESQAVPGGGEPIRDDDGNVVDFAPSSGLVAQNPRVADVGEVPGEKGGVTTGDVAAS
jgi:hypothetical protein